MGKIAEAKRELAAFRASDPYGLYRGEAALEMGRIALEYDLAPQAAKGCFLLLQTWLWEVQDKTPLNIERLAVREAAQKVTAPPAEEKYTDFWGNVKKSAVQPGQLVNRKTCPWYLDDLKEQMAMYLGFLAFVEGKKDEALAWYKRILECDPATRRMDTSGTANDYSRLKWGAEHGYLYAYPQELALFKDPRHRLGVLLCDFYYCTERNQDGIALSRRFLAGRYGTLRGAERDYVYFVLGSLLQRAGDRPGALSAFEKVLANKNSTFTERRAALAAGRLAITNPDGTVRERGKRYLLQLAQSRNKDSFAYTAMIVIGTHIARHEDRTAGIAILRAVPDDAGPYKGMANVLARMYGGETIESIMKAEESP